MLRFNGNNQVYITDSDTRSSTLKKEVNDEVLLQQWLRERASVTSHEHCRNAFTMCYKPNLLNIIQVLACNHGSLEFHSRPLLVRFVMDAVALR
jgi:hypothetical protein